MKNKILKLLLAAVILLPACKGKTYETDLSKADSVSVPMADTVATAPKIIKTAEMGLKVKNVQETSTRISALTARYKGIVMHHESTASVERANEIKVSDDSVMKISAINNNCQITAKVPSEKLDEYMEQVSHMGIYVTLRRMDLEDKTLDHLSSQLKVQGRKDFLAQHTKGKVVIKDPADVLMLKDDLVDEQISNLRIDDAVKYSVVNLNFYQSNTILKEMVANDDPSAYNIPFFKRMVLALGNGWYIFKEFILMLANAWVFIAAGFMIWLALRAYRRKGVLRAQV